MSSAATTTTTPSKADGRRTSPRPESKSTSASLPTSSGSPESPTAIPSAADNPSAASARGATHRCVLAGTGVLLVAIGAVGVITPGLPTTIFLIGACACFTRSSPALEKRLVRHRFFAPFHRYLEPGARMPLRAVIITLAMMWTAITCSSVWFALGLGWHWMPLVIAGLGGIGSAFVLRMHERFGK